MEYMIEILEFIKSINLVLRFLGLDIMIFSLLKFLLLGRGQVVRQ